MPTAPIDVEPAPQRKCRCRIGSRSMVASAALNLGLLHLVDSGLPLLSEGANPIQHSKSATLLAVERVSLQHQSSNLSNHPILQLRLQSLCHPVPVVSYPCHLQDSRLRHLVSYRGMHLGPYGGARDGEGWQNSLPQPWLPKSMKINENL